MKTTLMTAALLSLLTGPAWALGAAFEAPNPTVLNTADLAVRRDALPREGDVLRQSALRSRDHSTAPWRTAQGHAAGGRDVCATAADIARLPNPEQLTNDLRILAAMTDAVTSENHVTLINVFEVPDCAMEQTIEMWRQSRAFLQTQPGYVSTALHQSLGPDAKFALINVAVWENAQAYQAASAAMRAKMGPPAIAGLSFTPGLYKVIERD